MTSFGQVLDLKGSSPAQQNDLMDSFLVVTSTKTNLEDKSFLSSLDMDPGLITGLTSPGVTRNAVLPTSDGILAALGTPSSTPGSETPPTVDHTSNFTDFRRFVSFAVRRDTTPQ